MSPGYSRTVAILRSLNIVVRDSDCLTILGSPCAFNPWAHFEAKSAFIGFHHSRPMLNCLFSRPVTCGCMRGPRIALFVAVPKTN